jgi:hypothetical protein
MTCRKQRIYAARDVLLFVASRYDDRETREVGLRFARLDFVLRAQDDVERPQSEDDVGGAQQERNDNQRRRSFLPAHSNRQTVNRKAVNARRHIPKSLS